LKFDQIEIEKIDLSEANVRKEVDKISEEDFDSLVKSIKLKGVLQPVLVVPKGVDRYELFVGQCRLRASQKAGLKKIPALIYDKIDSSSMRIISAIENLHRIKLTPADEAAALKELLKELGSPAAVAKAIGKSEPYVRYTLGYEGMPERVKQLVNQGELKMHEIPKLKSLVRWQDPNETSAVAEEIAKLKGEKRGKALDIARRSIALSPEELKTQLAKKPPVAIIKIEISDAEMEALRRAAEDVDQDPEDIVRSVIHDWLREHGYIAK